jgi:hypothetical protein
VSTLYVWFVPKERDTPWKGAYVVYSQSSEIYLL